MSRYKSQRIFPIILTIIIIIISVALLVSLARALLFSGSKDTTTDSDDISLVESALLSTSDNRSVRLTVRGQIVADENFRSYRITISPSSRSMQSFRGYLDTVIRSKSYNNNTTAYDEFVHALEKANLIKGATELTNGSSDVRGVCAAGRVYEFELLKDDEVVESIWTSTCSKSQGTLDASYAQLAGLFKLQIPDATEILEEIDLSLDD